MGNSLQILKFFSKHYNKIICKLNIVIFHHDKGMFDLRVWPGVEGSELTPGKAPDKGKEQMQRLSKLAKKHRNGHMPKVIFFNHIDSTFFLTC